MSETTTFDATVAAKALLSDPATFYAVAAGFNAEQHAAVADAVKVLQQDTARSEGVKAIAASKSCHGDADAIYDAFVLVAEAMATNVTLKTDADGGWSGYAVGRRAIPTPFGRVKVTLTP